jgi:hypothetical protein
MMYGIDDVQKVNQLEHAREIFALKYGAQKWWLWEGRWRPSNSKYSKSVSKLPGMLIGATKLQN